MFERAELFLKLLLAREQALESLDRGVVARSQMAADSFKDPLAAANRLKRPLTRRGFDSAHARGDARFALEFENPYIAGAADVSAAAQFDREIAHPDHTHDVAILVAEERERASFDRVVIGHLFGRDLRVFADTCVDLLFDRRQVALAHRAGVREIEAQTVGRDQRARLMDPRTEHVAQRIVQDVSRGMIKHRGVAARPIDAQRDAPAAIEIARVAAEQPADMENRAVRLARIDNLEKRAGGGLDYAAVANLSAAFGIEGRFGGYQEDAVSPSRWAARTSDSVS